MNYGWMDGWMDEYGWMTDEYTPNSFLFIFNLPSTLDSHLKYNIRTIWHL